MNNKPRVQVWTTPMREFKRSEDRTYRRVSRKGTHLQTYQTNLESETIVVRDFDVQVFIDVPKLINAAVARVLTTRHLKSRLFRGLVTAKAINLKTKSKDQIEHPIPEGYELYEPESRPRSRTIDELERRT